MHRTRLADSSIIPRRHGRSGGGDGLGRRSRDASPPRSPPRMTGPTLRVIKTLSEIRDSPRKSREIRPEIRISDKVYSSDSRLRGCEEIQGLLSNEKLGAA